MGTCCVSVNAKDKKGKENAPAPPLEQRRDKDLPEV